MTREQLRQITEPTQQNNDYFVHHDGKKYISVQSGFDNEGVYINLNGDAINLDKDAAKDLLTTLKRLLK